jgi:hypothetical protein
MEYNLNVPFDRLLNQIFEVRKKHFLNAWSKSGDSKIDFIEEKEEDEFSTLLYHLKQIKKLY